jgi:hypothetical protein
MDLFEAHFEKQSEGGTLHYCRTMGDFKMFRDADEIDKRYHICYLTFKELYKQLLNIKYPNIIETGTAAWGTNSTFLFNDFVRKFGGRFWTVDINPDTSNKVRPHMCHATTVITNDSVSFLTDWSTNKLIANAVYLDSYDLDFSNPIPSGQHGLEEYKAIRPSLTSGSLLLIDDTPVSPYWTNSRDKTYNNLKQNYTVENYKMPGKGMFIIDTVSPHEAITLMHQYQLLYKFT